MSKKINPRELYNEILQYAGQKRGDEAKAKYEIYKLEQERKRNSLLLFNTILLTIITIVNVVIAFLKYMQDK